MTHIEEWFIVNETHAPDLVCHRRIGHADDSEGSIAWDEVPGLVMIITEHRYRLDTSGLVIGLVDTRTRLVVREVGTSYGNGCEYGLSPLVVDDDDVYQGLVFTARDGRVLNDTDVTDRATSSTEPSTEPSTELRELYEGHAQVMRTLAEITRLRDETTRIRDAAIRAFNAYIR